jgi:purine-binding chemotaxis protein CheW
VEKMDETRSDGKMHQMVSFKLGTEEFGIDILEVQEIIKYQRITHVPQTPEFVEGVINLRGSVVPVIDLRKKFSLEAKEKDDRTRIVVVNINQKTIGVVVDTVEQVLRLSENQIEKPPDIGTGIVKEYLRGVGKLDQRLLIILHLDKILTSDEIFQLEGLDQLKNTMKEPKEKKKEEGKKEEKDIEKA